MNTPNHVGDQTINELFDLAVEITRDHAKKLLADPALGARLDAQLSRATDARMFDLQYEYTSFAPIAERWACVDQNTYDGAPDSQAPATFIGRGASEKEARMDLLEQFAAYDYPELPATAAERELDEAIDDGITFDDGLEP